MRGPRKWDPAAVEKEFVTGEDSIRVIAERHKVSFSSMAKYAREHDWQGKRLAYRAALSRNTYEMAAQRQASRDVEVRDESITVLRATLQAYAKRLVSGEIPVNTKDAIEAVRTLAELLKPADSGGGDAPSATQRYKPDADLLRGVAEAARRKLSERAVGGVAGEEPEGTLPN